MESEGDGEGYDRQGGDVMERLGFIGIDQYGYKYIIKKYPRKELLEQIGHRYASRMYRDLKDGKVRHIGYVIAGRWIEVFSVCSWR